MRLRKRLVMVVAPILLIITGASFATVFVPDFPDVVESDWFYYDVRYVRYAGLMQGYENGNFGPHDAVTRAQMAKVITTMNKEMYLMKQVICANKEILRSANAAPRKLISGSEETLVSEEEEYMKLINNICSDERGCGWVIDFETGARRLV